VDTVDTEDLVDYSITRMLEKLDPHSVYIPVKEVDAVNAEIKGNFEGIGVEFSIVKDTIYVVSPLSGGPSETVGIKAGDKIIKVNDENVAGVNISNKGVFDRLRGAKGTKVRVMIMRKDVKELLSFEITRDKIPQFSVEVSYMVDNKTGYIKITRFASTTYDEFRKALTDLSKEGMSQLILDLRDNPGGFLDRATKICDELLDEGNLIVYTKSRDTRFNEKYVATDRGNFQTQPIIVLINEGSASAS
jgi:carboxyl-terminal processing protease